MEYKDSFISGNLKIYYTILIEKVYAIITVNAEKSVWDGSVPIYKEEKSLVKQE